MTRTLLAALAASCLGACAGAPKPPPAAVADLAAGVRQQLEADARRVADLRLLPGRFMVINQAMGMQRGREAGAKYLTAFVEEMKASGFVAEALRRHGIEGAAVAPAGGGL